VGLRRAGLAEQGDRDELTYEVMLIVDLLSRVDDAGRDLRLPAASVRPLRDLLVAVIGALGSQGRDHRWEGLG
jgi:hypothetical protein